MENFLEKIAQAAEQLKSFAYKGVLLLHHNDADGLTSGAILSCALERAGCSVRRVCLEKPYPQVLTELFDDPLLEAGNPVIFTDFASGMIGVLERLNKRKSTIFVVDHHQISASPKSKYLHLVNCNQFGIPGSTDCSSSATAYLVARAMDGANRDMAPIGVIGAVGDKHFNSKGELTGVNKRVFDEAVELGIASFPDKYVVTLGESLPAAEIVSDLDALGSYGYFRGGPDIGVKGLLEGFDGRYRDRAAEFRGQFEEVFKDFIKDFKPHLTPHLNWFILPPPFLPFGVKSVGLICEQLIQRELVDSARYVVGLQEIPGEIPGVGPVQFDSYKVSLRVPPHLLKKVEMGESPPLTKLVPEAAGKVGGFVDACHVHAAACSIEIGREGELIEALEAMLGTGIRSREV